LLLMNLLLLTWCREQWNIKVRQFRYWTSGTCSRSRLRARRGKEVIAVIRNADLAVILLDVFQLVHHEVLLQELYEAGIRVNSRPPDITIKKKARGGVIISSTVDLDLSEDTIKQFSGNTGFIMLMC